MKAFAFQGEYASQYGVDEAIVITHLQYWICHNKTLGLNFRDGRTWTYQTQEQIAAHFEWWNRKQIMRIIDSLLDQGVIIKGNYNRTPFDKTTWYAFKNEEIFAVVQNGTISGQKRENGSVETRQPIPDNRTDNRTDPKEFVADDPGGSPRAQTAPFSEVQEPKEKEPEVPQSEGPLQPGTITLHGGHKGTVIVTQSELFQRSLHSKINPRTEELCDAWKVLAEYSGIVQDWWRFIEGTIENKRNAHKSKMASRDKNSKGQKIKENACQETLPQSKMTCNESSSEKTTSAPVSGKSVMDLYKEAMKR